MLAEKFLSFTAPKIQFSLYLVWVQTDSQDKILVVCLNWTLPSLIPKHFRKTLNRKGIGTFTCISICIQTNTSEVGPHQFASNMNHFSFQHE